MRPWRASYTVPSFSRCIPKREFGYWINNFSPVRISSPGDLGHRSTQESLEEYHLQFEVGDSILEVVRRMMVIEFFNGARLITLRPLRGGLATSRLALWRIFCFPWLRIQCNSSAWDFIDCEEDAGPRELPFFLIWQNQLMPGLAMTLLCTKVVPASELIININWKRRLGQLSKGRWRGKNVKWYTRQVDRIWECRI